MITAVAFIALGTALISIVLSIVALWLWWTHDDTGAITSDDHWHGL